MFLCHFLILVPQINDLLFRQELTIPLSTTDANGISAYGGFYNDVPRIITLDADIPSVIGFNAEMTSNNVTLDAALGTITIIKDGDYEINYKLTIFNVLDLIYTHAIRVNTINIPQTVSIGIIPADTEYFITGSVIVSLSAGDIIDMTISNSNMFAVEVNLGSGTNAVLSVKKLSE